MKTYAEYVISLNQHNKPQVHMVDGYLDSRHDILNVLSTQDKITNHNAQCRDLNAFAEYYIAHGLVESKIKEVSAKYSSALYKQLGTSSLSMFASMIVGDTLQDKTNKILGLLGKMDSGYAVERFAKFKLLLVDASELLMEDFFIRAINVLTKTGRPDLALNIVKLADNSMTELDLANEAKLKTVFTRLAQGVKARNVSSFFQSLPYTYGAQAQAVNDTAPVLVRRPTMNGTNH
jgi:hypothetical protein